MVNFISENLVRKCNKNDLKWLLYPNVNKSAYIQLKKLIRQKLEKQIFVFSGCH